MLCKICNHDKLEKLVLKYGLYYKCINCKVIFKDQSEIVPPNKEVSRYLTHNNSIFNFKYRNYLNSCIKGLSIYTLPKDSDILDFGCGYQPVLSELLRKKGYNVFNYDLYFNSNEENLNKKYDAIVSIEVFEHFLAPAKTIVKISDMLNPGGKLFISTRLYPDNIDELNKWWYMKDETHIIFYTEDTIKYISKKYNFEDYEIRKNKFIILTKGH